MLKNLYSKTRLALSTIFLLAITISLNAFIFSITIPPVYSQTTNAWNLQRSGAGNDLNIYYNNGSNLDTALQLNTNGVMRARRMIDLDTGASNFVTDPNSLSVMSGIRLGDSTIYTGTANALTVRRAGADSAIYQTLINEGTVTHTIRSGGAGLRKDLVFTNDAGGNYSFSNQLTVPSLNLNLNGSLITFPDFQSGLTSYTGFGTANGNMSDGVPWYFGIGREPGPWSTGSGPYPNLIINNHVGIALSAHGGFINGGVGIYEELNAAGNNWQAKGKEVARFRHTDYGGSYFTGMLGVGTTAPKGTFAVGFNGGSDQLITFQPTDNKLALQTTLDNQPNSGYGGDANILAIQPTAGRVGIGTSTVFARLTVNVGGEDSLNVYKPGEDMIALQTTLNAQDISGYGGDVAQRLLLQPVVGNVGIGTYNPTSKLQVQGTTRVSGAFATNGWDPLGCGANSPADNITFGNCLAGSAFIQNDLRVGRWLGLNGYSALGCGGHGLCVGGNGWSNASFISGSDIRTKKNIHPLKDALSKVLSLEGVTFEFAAEKFPGKNYPTDLQIGFIAQQVEPIVPEVVETGTDGMKAIAYPNLTALLVEAVKEQNLEVKNLEEEVENQKKANNTLTEEVNALRNELYQLKEAIQNLEK